MKKRAIGIRLNAFAVVELVSLTDEVLKALRKDFKSKNPEFFKKRQMGYSTANEPEYFLTYREEHGLIRFWRGGVKRLRAKLEKYGYEVRFIDQRKSFKPVGLSLGTLVPHPEQLEAAKDMVKYQQGILRGETGSGKTETAIIAAVLANQPTLIIVWNKDLLAQWKTRILKYGILRESDIGIIQGAKNTYGLLTIAMVQSLHKRVDQWAGKFGTVIMDECQRAPATTFSKSIIEFPAKYKWGLSADETRRDGKEALAYEAFGYQEYNDTLKKTKYKPIHIIEGRGQALEPTIKIVGTEYEDDGYESERVYTQMISRLIKDETRNDLIAYHLKQELKHGSQVILFSDRVDAAIYWSELVASWGYFAGPLIGGVKYEKQTKAMIGHLQSGKARFTSTTTYADVGLDVATLDRAFLTCPSAGNIKRAHQQIGRIVRPHPDKGDPVAYYFWDRNVSGLAKHKKNIEKKWDNTILL